MQSWQDILLYVPGDTCETIRKRFKSMAVANTRFRHPNKGGSADGFAQLQQAWELAQRTLCESPNMNFPNRPSPPTNRSQPRQSSYTNVKRQYVPLRPVQSSMNRAYQEFHRAFMAHERGLERMTRRNRAPPKLRPRAIHVKKKPGNDAAL